MEMREQKTIVYDSNGYKETIIEMVPKIEINNQELIQQKEQQLLSMYEELEKLKQINN
jgi:hypothetical protein